MKKETSQQIFKRKVSDKLMDIIFEKKEVEKPTLYTTEEQMLFLNNDLNIKVQSVALPKGFVCLDKTEVEILDWMQNKVHNINTAFYKINSKYDGDTDRVNWNNNKMQNQRFLETKNLYKDKQ